VAKHLFLWFSLQHWSKYDVSGLTPRILKRLNSRSGALTDHRSHVATHQSGSQEKRAAGACSGRLTFRVDGHRGEQQSRKREKRHERSHAREGRGDLRGDGGNQHVEQQRPSASPAG
jgi:hypothetical protein